MRLIASLFAIAGLGVPAAAEPTIDAPVVRIETGAVRGTVEDGIASWKGIPFAAPPVGPLRWRAPQPPGAWDGVREATGYAPDCMQKPFPSDAAPLGTEPAEDCLYINLWKPVGAEGKLPVVVWIYGGGFVNGGSSPPTYSGAKLASRDVVFVSFNYRVGRFGTFAHPALTRANPDNGLLGNYGYMDQLAALRWVERNIAAFGGDPENVTIVGESAGGMSVHFLVTSPMAEGLFDKAVVMSGGNGGSMRAADFAATEAIGVNFARTNGIATNDPEALEKLRALPAAKVTDGLNLATMSAVNDAGERTFASPFPDGLIAVDAEAAYEDGDFAKAPMMIGATSADIGGPTGIMVAGAREIAGEVAEHGVPVWQYRFSYVAESVDSEGAQHATDIPFFFDTAEIKYGDQTTARDRQIARLMGDYLTNFAKTGNPNGDELPQWLSYDPTGDQIMDFEASGEAVLKEDPLGARLDAAAAERD
ncbi:carboxylesterase/lipase family protein [Qipengyuania sp.]|uniref:carboxylesterase/lipase family protein n=1 Tax=Qipengyuania sp. TaxID=2004515 RepID=UPI0035C87532